MEYAMQVKEYIDKKGLKYKRRGSNAVMNCPFCGDKENKFAVSLESGAFNCLHLNNCGVKGSFYDLQIKLGDKPDKQTKETFVRTKKKAFKVPSVNVTKAEGPVESYIKGRGLTKETIEHFRFGSKNGSAVMIPFYRNGVLVNVKYRSITDKSMWQEEGAEQILFNRDNIYDDKLVICEGEYDAAALYQYGINAVSVPNGAGGLTWVENEWDYLNTFNLIYISFDNDQAGQDGAKELAIRIGEWKCKNVILPRKDANACVKDGVSRDDVWLCFTSAEDFKPETLVDPMYFEDKVKHLFSQGSLLFGTPTPWTKLNSILKGWRGGELTIWSGKNGAGKSTILNQVLIDLGKNNIKTCIYSGEMPPERYLRWAIIQYLKDDKPTTELVHEALYWMNPKVKILNLTSIIDPDKLLSDFEYAAQRYGVKHFIIDSLMKIQFKEVDEYRQQQVFVSRLCGFAQKFNCHIHLVAHPRKTDSDDDEADKVDVKGSSHITDLAHNVIVIHRLTENKKDAARKKGSIPADMKLSVKKNREFGIEGSVNMTFDETTKTFSDGG
jgi:twinkle protein